MSPPLTISDFERDLIRAEVACRIAYLEDRAAVAKELDLLGLELVRVYRDEDTGADAFLARGEHRAIISVAGTGKNFADIVTDLDFRMIDYQPNDIGRVRGKCHRGFYHQFKAIKAEVLGDINNLKAQGVTTEAVGHSLGVVALHFAAAGKINHVTTFGAPRLGNRAFAEYCNERRFTHRRFVRGADIVPLVPLLAMGARHDVPALYFSSSGRLYPDASMKREIFSRAMALLTFDWTDGWTPCPVPKRMFTDHRGQGYIDAIRAHLEWLRDLQQADDVA